MNVNLIEDVAECLEMFRQSQLKSLECNEESIFFVCEVTAAVLFAGNSQAMDLALDYSSHFISW